MKDVIGLDKRTVRICRTIALGEVAERTKTGQERILLLNESALHALEHAMEYAEHRK